MKYSETQQGRIFIIRLEDGEIIHKELEKFAAEQKIKSAFIQVVGGADTGSRLISGPEDGRAEKIVPIERVLNNVHETVGTGTIFPDETGNPLLHLHLACGREGETVTGCARNGVKTWQVLEVILVELVNSSAGRFLDDATGFKLLIP